MDKVLLIYVLTLIANIIDVLSYSVFIVGVKTRKLAISNALFQAVMIISRVAIFIQAPLIGSIADEAILNNNVDDLALIFRNIIFVTTLGSLLGALFAPAFIDVFSSLTNYFERLGTIPKMISSLIFNINKVLEKKVRIESYKEFKNVSLDNMPKGLLILNALAISIYSVGLLSSIYAGALMPEYRMTASQLSGLIVGIGAALFMIFIDPMIAVITDQTMEGKMSPEYIKSLVFFLALADFVGTLISQVLFLPLTDLIIFAAKNI